MSDQEINMSLEAELDFGLALLRQIPINEASVFSPLSIAFALALIHSGTNGKSKSQIREAVFKNGSDEEFVQHFQSLSEKFREKNDLVQLDIANRLFLKDNFKPLPSYLETVSKKYGAEAQPLNFSDADNSAKTVNAFIEKSTGGKIKEIVTPDSFQDAVAILTNALYFKAEWQEKFYALATHPVDFWTNADSKRQIDFMSDYEEHRLYFNDNKAAILTLNYTDDDYGFSIILPNERFGLASFLSQLTAADLNRYLSSVKNTYITLHIPKMKLEKELDLKQALPALGITDIFGENADFSALAEQKLRISDAKHKAIIEVDEEGTVAAASTFAKAVLMSAYMDEPVVFSADHPFIYALTYKNHPIFLGVFA